jgi:hypothetical protein
MLSHHAPAKVHSTPKTPSVYYLGATRQQWMWMLKLGLEGIDFGTLYAYFLTGKWLKLEITPNSVCFL